MGLPYVALVPRRIVRPAVPVVGHPVMIGIKAIPVRGANGLAVIQQARVFRLPALGGKIVRPLRFQPDPLLFQTSFFLQVVCVVIPVVPVCGGMRGRGGSRRCYPRDEKTGDRQRRS